MGGMEYEFFPRENMILTEENILLTEGDSPSVNLIFSEANIIFSRGKNSYSITTINNLFIL